MINPFDEIARRLADIEGVLVDIKNRPTTPLTTRELDEPLTPDETAALFKTSKVSLWSWEKKGLIKGYHLGNKKYFLRSEMLDALTKKGGARI